MGEGQDEELRQMGESGFRNSDRVRLGISRGRSHRNPHLRVALWVVRNRRRVLGWRPRRGLERRLVVVALFSLFGLLSLGLALVSLAWWLWLWFSHRKPDAGLLVFPLGLGVAGVLQIVGVLAFGGQN